jgi:hypothetical protein
MRVREYRRALEAELPALEADGWRVVAASHYADRQVSVLVVRELADRDEDTDRDEVGG